MSLEACHEELLARLHRADAGRRIGLTSSRQSRCRVNCMTLVLPVAKAASQ